MMARLPSEPAVRRAEPEAVLHELRVAIARYQLHLEAEVKTTRVIRRRVRSFG
jgi:hypothetical protein